MAAGESEQPSDEAACGTRCPLHGRDLTGDLLERGRVGWVGMHGGCHIAGPQATRDGEAQLPAQLSGAACDNVRANQDAAAVLEQLVEPMLVIVPCPLLGPIYVPTVDLIVLTQTCRGGPRPSCHPPD